MGLSGGKKNKGRPGGGRKGRKGAAKAGKALSKSSSRKRMVKELKRAEERKKGRKGPVAPPGAPGMDVEAMDESDVEMKTNDLTSLRIRALQKEVEYSSHSHNERVQISVEKRFMREFNKVVHLADVVVQVVDARDPLGCRSRTLEMELLILVNKTDLIPSAVAADWKRAFDAENVPAVFLSAKRGSVANRTVLIRALSDFRESAKESLLAGFVGLPNVGKSSIINFLARRQSAAPVGALPGFTTQVSEITVTRNLRVLDCPGVFVDTSARLVLHSAIDVARSSDSALIRKSLSDLVGAVPLSFFAEFYELPQEPVTLEDLLRGIALRRGKLLPGGSPNTIAASFSLLADWCNGVIRYFVAPMGLVERCVPGYLVIHANGDVAWDIIRQKSAASTPNRTRQMFDPHCGSSIISVPDASQATADFALLAGTVQVDATDATLDKLRLRL